MRLKLWLILYYSLYVYFLNWFLSQVGRSGRFGHLGLAVNLITYEDRYNLYNFSFYLKYIIISSLLFLIFFPMFLLFPQVQDGARAGDGN